MPKFTLIFTILSSLSIGINAFSQDDADIMFGSNWNYGTSKYFTVFNENGKFGVKQNDNNTIVLEAVYSTIKYNTDQFLFEVYKGDSIGIFNPVKQIFFAPVIYKKINYETLKKDTWTNNRFIICKDFSNNNHLIYATKEEVKTSFLNVSSFQKIYNSDLIIIKENKCSCIFSTTSEAVVVPCEYDKIEQFRVEFERPGPKSKPFVLTKANLMGLYDPKTGKTVQPQFDSLSYSFENVIGWKKKTVTVFPKNKESWEIERPFSLKSNNDAIAFQNMKKKWSLYSTSNVRFDEKLYDTVFLSIPKYSYMDDAEAATPIFAYVKDELTMIKNDNSSRVVIPDGSVNGMFKSKYILVNSGKKSGLYTIDLQPYMEPKYDSIMMWFSEKQGKNLWACQLNDWWYFTGENGIYDSIQSDYVQVFDGRESYLAMKGGKIALINATTKQKPEFVYDFVEVKIGSPERLARIGEKYVYLSSSGATRPTDYNYTKTGYKTLDEVAKAFTEALNSTDNALLQKFVLNITPDFGSYEFMNGYLADYRKMFSNFSQSTINESYTNYYTRILEFKQKLSSRYPNTTFENNGFSEDFLRKADISPRLKLEGTESGLVFKAGTETVDIKLGELFIIDGYFKTFTMPKMN